MNIIKCHSCGSTEMVKIETGVYECAHCGTQQVQDVPFGVHGDIVLGSKHTGVDQRGLRVHGTQIVVGGHTFGQGDAEDRIVIERDTRGQVVGEVIEIDGSVSAEDLERILSGG